MAKAEIINIIDGKKLEIKFEDTNETEIIGNKELITKKIKEYTVGSIIDVELNGIAVKSIEIIKQAPAKVVLIGTTGEIYPYNFVSLGSKIERTPMTKGELSGKIECTLKNLTPLSTGIEENENTAKLTNYTIAAATLKGEIRRIVEVITRSCIGNTKVDVKKLDKFEICSEKNNLCFACRMFGTTGGEGGDFGYSSKVFFEDAISEKIRKIDFEEKIFVMGPPDSTVKRLYFKDKGTTIRGRKFYWNCIPTRGRTKENRSSSKMDFLKQGKEFRFTVHFKNLTEEELGVLIYSIELEKDLYHRIGRAKCYGHGRCEMKISKILLEGKNKYKTFSSGYELLNDKEKYKNIAMQKYINDTKEIKEFKKISGLPQNNVKFFRIKVLPEILDY